MKKPLKSGGVIYWPDLSSETPFGGRTSLILARPWAKRNENNRRQSDWS
jgi:hypothetical protein